MPTPRRAILHADLDAFYASVEQRDDPALRGRPTAVGPGVVMAASYEARASGVRAGLGVAAARRRCPELRVVPARFDAYVEAGEAVHAVLRAHAPLVESLSIDEAFLDVTGLERVTGTPAEIAAAVRRAVREQVGLPITVGGGSTTQVAKLASGAGKPDGLLVLAPEDERAFLDRLPVERIWGVGTATARRLRRRGWATIADLAAAGEPALVAAVGASAGRRLHAIAHNRESRAVRAERRRRSFGAQAARRIPAGGHAEADAAAMGLLDRIARRMREAGHAGRTVTLRLRFADFSVATRSATLARPSAETDVLLATARGLLAAEHAVLAARDLTLVGFSVSGLERVDEQQLELPFGTRVDRAPPPATGDGLDAALDAIRRRHGGRAIQRARLLGRPAEHGEGWADARLRERPSRRSRREPPPLGRPPGTAEDRRSGPAGPQGP